MQASTWICTYQMQSIKVHELAPPTCVLLLSKNFDPSLFSNVAPALSIFMSNLLSFHILSLPLHNLSLPPIEAFISLYNLSPFVINFHKRWVSHWCKGMHFGVDGWGLNLAFFMDISCLLEWHHLYIPLVTCTPCILCRASWDTTHKIFDLVINLWDTSPYVIAWVIHLIHLSSCRWGMHSSFDDHLWNHHLAWLIPHADVIPLERIF